ncbi:MAG: ligase-associated DNA damage response DEXH box helicase [Rickettsiales bacterium]
MEGQLPIRFSEWFAGRGWHPHAHQLQMLAAARDGVHALLIAPTGGGKTLAGFLPSLLDLAEGGAEGLHTLYVSPLKALAVDVERNLTSPVAEMGLPIRVETRTGDTPQHKRQRQRFDPPHMLLTTPESLALLLSYPDAARYFRNLRTVVVDEIHAMADNKRGDQLALCLSRLHSLAPRCRRVGLSATVAWPEALKSWLAPGADPDAVRLIEGRGGAEGRVSILTTKAEMPWSGHSGVHALGEVYGELKRARNTIVFVNTRGLSEIVFQELWRLNAENLPIALHHGSLSRENRRKVEAAMAAGKLRAVVATSSLDLGIDWAEVDLVIQMGAPKGVSRLIQRMGRSGHRLDTPSRAILVPGNRFEVLECRAALEAVYAQSLDGDPPGEGGLDILAQHIMIVACSGPFHPEALYAEIRAAAPYAALSRRDFDDVLAFVDHGGYALRTYERWRRLHLLEDGRYRTRSRGVVQRLRMNIGTIVEAETLKVRLGRGRILGEVEEYFAMGLEIGDSFIFAGRMLRFEGIREQTVIASQAPGTEPKVPAFVGGRLPLTTHLADRVRAMLADPSCWGELPDQVQDWLRLQRHRSELPGADELLVESFRRGQREFLVAYCFEGRNAHQTLGMLLTRRMERAGYAPMGFVATDYVIAVWGLNPVTDVEALFDEDMLGDDLEAWMDESSMLKRTFRNVAVIAGLIERNYPGKKKTGRQVTFSSDLIYDTLRQHEPDHILLRATRRDAAKGLTDIRRLGDMLRRAKGRIRYRRLERVSPLAVPVLLEIGKERIDGAADDQLLGEAAADLIAEATGRP